MQCGVGLDAFLVIAAGFRIRISFSVGLVVVSNLAWDVGIGVQVE